MTRRKIVLLSGLSNPRSCALSSVQSTFIQSLPIDESERILLNFPYLPEFSGPQRSPSLLSASFANAVQFLQARGNEYQKLATPHWDALVESCDELTVITLSCGLEILNACLIAGRRPARIHAVCLGPVARRRPAVPHTLVGGSRDYISRPFFGKVDYSLSGIGHLDYLEVPKVTEIVCQLLN